MIESETKLQISVKAKEKLPHGWVWAKIEDVCLELLGGGTPSRQIPEYFGGDIVWLTPKEVPKSKITILNDSKERITELGLQNSSAKLIPTGSTSRATIGSVAIAGRDVTTNQGFASLVCSSRIYKVVMFTTIPLIYFPTLVDMWDGVGIAKTI
jgi:type I restriction enzyme S subunit